MCEVLRRGSLFRLFLFFCSSPIADRRKRASIAHDCRSADGALFTKRSQAGAVMGFSLVSTGGVRTGVQEHVTNARGL
jgi:hypothetical protein